MHVCFCVSVHFVLMLTTDEGVQTEGWLSRKILQVLDDCLKAENARSWFSLLPLTIHRKCWGHRRGRGKGSNGINTLPNS